MPATRPVRRSQLISPFGIGAMVNFPGDQTLMTAGLDAWEFAERDCPADWLVMEERLQARLGADHFRQPPEHRDPGAGVTHPNLSVPYVRFPRWHYCHRCGDMEHLSLFETNRQRCRGRRLDGGMTCADLAERRRPYLIPIRIVSVCGRGHIQDFPFVEWVHQGRSVGEGCRLRFRAGRSSASLAGIKISCSCGAQQSLAGVFDFDAKRGGALHRRLGYDCRGSRPWLGQSDGEPGACGEYLRVVQRGGSNVYFPYVVSSIYLPLWAENARRAVVDALENPRYWRALTDSLEDGVRIDPSKATAVAAVLDLDAGELVAAAQRKLDGIPEAAASLTEETYRRQEYDALREGRGGAETELLVRPQEPEAFSPDVGPYFARVCLVRKLRETRVLAGFTRLVPPDPEDAGQSIQPLRLSPTHDWLPALTVRGEGVFLEFDAERVGAWAQREEVQARARRVSEAFNRRRVDRGQAVRVVTPELIAIHTLSHLLINQLAFDCGYGSASIRERLYCETSADADPMLGLLLYTASGDAEGTMGGLVRQGEPGRFEATLERALEDAQWCSSDPVCIESGGQGTDSANLAACHGCALVSETSCEEGNRLLDRGLVVGTPQNPELGLFAELVAALSQGAA